MKPLFNPGREVMTNGVSEWASEGPFTEAGVSARHYALIQCLNNHVQGQWGEVSPEDAAANEAAVKTKDMILSAYTVDGQAIWISTDAGHGVTTILFPREY